MMAILASVLKPLRYTKIMPGVSRGHCLKQCGAWVQSLLTTKCYFLVMIDKITLKLVNCVILSSGGYDGSNENKIMEFNPETGEWSVVGYMKKARRHDRVSVVSFVDYKNWCN